MIQTHQQLKIISEEYNSLFSKNEFYPLQKAWTTPHFIVLSVRFPGKTVQLYIGRGNQYQGLYLSEVAPPSFLRVQDRFLDYVRKYLVGARIGKIEIDENFQSLKFSFKNEHTDNSFLIGYKERQLFFIRQHKDEHYTSWSGETLKGVSLTKILEDFHPDKGIKGERIFLIHDYLKEEEKKNGGKPLQKKKEKFLERKMRNITSDFQAVCLWREMESDLLNEKINLDLDETQIYGQKFKFHGVHSVWQKKDLIFKKIKKLKIAEQILSKRLEETKVEFENVCRGDFEIEITKERVIQPLWKSAVPKTSASMINFHVKEFRLKNFSGVMGLDSASNDFIRSQANKEHYWFHIENYPGAHCILKTDDFGKLLIDDLEAIASILRDYSKLAITEIPVMYTQVKNIKGMKGVKGEVIVKKPKHLRCLYRDWKEIITVL